ncbi:MAG: RNA polymerase sigma factor [Planctomycetota bacterium]
MNDAEISALIHAAQSGSIGAFAEIIRCFQHDVRRAVTRHLGHIPDVDDVAQDVFVQAWQNLSSYQSTGSLRAWLLGIARHRALDFLRRETVRRRRRDLLFDFAEADLLAAGVETQSEDAEGDQVMRRLQTCLEQLEPRQQSLIARFYFEDESAESIAAELGRRPGTIRMMLLRIRTALRKCIERRGISESVQ